MTSFLLENSFNGELLAEFVVEVPLVTYPVSSTSIHYYSQIYYFVDVHQAHEIQEALGLESVNLLCQEVVGHPDYQSPFQGCIDLEINTDHGVT